MQLLGAFSLYKLRSYFNDVEFISQWFYYIGIPALFLLLSNALVSNLFTKSTGWIYESGFMLLVWGAAAPVLGYMYWTLVGTKDSGNELYDGLKSVAMAITLYAPVICVSLSFLMSFVDAVENIVKGLRGENKRSG
jgi:hypothetical protein